MTAASLPAVAPVDAAGTRFSVDVKQWETEFFGRVFGSVTWAAGESDRFRTRQTAEALDVLIRRADDAGFAVLECHVDARQFTIAAAIERIGFRLVDSRVRFVTKWAVADIPDMTPARGRVLDAAREHRGRIIELTHAGFTDNELFVSRFKDRNYFTAKESRRYFEAWIDNAAFEADSASAVFEVDGAVVGYYVYQARGSHRGLPLVKGILTAVDPEFRGADAQLAMQAHLYRRLGFAEWYLDNTTQLTNLPVIRNHMRSGKRLEEIVLTFYRSPVG